jgi:1-acyl-sn-glycerol-3-phosphate acyltransferase
MRGIVKIYKVTLLVLLSLVFLCVGLIISIFPAKCYRLRAATTYMSIWARWACAILGLRIRKTGPDRIAPGSFVVANHCSYLDILVLGSLFPAAFVAKKEVESWFLIGPLARLAGTVFVNRTSRMKTIPAMEEIENRLSSCISVILFPEGTTNNGMDMLAFKSSFFKIPVEGNHPVLPVSLIYSHINGKPVSEEARDCIAWHGAMGLLPHLWNMLGMKKIDVRVHFNPVILDITAFAPVHARKILCSFAHESVRSGWVSLRHEGIEHC